LYKIYIRNSPSVSFGKPKETRKQMPRYENILTSRSINSIKNKSEKHRVIKIPGLKFDSYSKRPENINKSINVLTYIKQNNTNNTGHSFYKSPGRNDKKSITVCSNTPPPSHYNPKFTYIKERNRMCKIIFTIFYYN
jgi:hypothetical protein